MKPSFVNINPPEQGNCFVCEQIVPLRVRDLTINAAVGDCCYADLRAAHLWLGRWPGVRHPEPGEMNAGS